MLNVLTCIVWIKFLKLCWFGFSKTLISSDLFYPEKPNSKSKYILGLSLKAKNVELVELYKVDFWSFQSCLEKFGVIWKGVIL